MDHKIAQRLRWVELFEKTNDAGLVCRRCDARKFFCSNSACKQAIFCELLPEVADPYARRTLRLNDSLEVIGFALGGRPGARAAAQL